MAIPVCSGVIDKRLNGESIIAVPLDEEDTIHIGYITQQKDSSEPPWHKLHQCFRALYCKFGDWGEKISQPKD